MSTAPAGERTRGSRRTAKSTVVGLGVLGGALAAAAASQTWGSGTSTGEVVGIRSVSATGGQLLPLVPALGLVGAAAAIAVATTGRVARVLAAAAMVLAGAGVVASTLVLLAGLGHALGEHAATMSAHTEVVDMHARVTAWPWVAVAGGVLLAVAGVLAVLALRRWPAPPRRYERPAAGTTPARELTLWEQVGHEVDTDADVHETDPGRRSDTPNDPVTPSRHDAGPKT